MTYALDDVVGNDDLFPVLRHWQYFNHAGVAPLSRVGAETVSDWAKSWSEEAILGRDWFSVIRDVRQSAAELIGGTAGEVALLKNTSEGISTVARGIDWRRGARIVTTAAEYPSNLYPWMDAADRRGLELVKVPETTGDDGAVRVSVDEIIAEAGRGDTQMVAVSHVQWSSGQRLDLKRIGDFCHANGILFGVDAIQSVGVRPIDVEACHVDYLWAGCHKWQLGPLGCGLFYCSERVRDATRPGLLGWHSVADPFDWDTIDLTLAEDAARYECGSPNIPGLLLLRENHKLLLGLGTDTIAGHTATLTDRLVDGLRERGWQVLSPRGEGETSTIVTFTGDRDGEELVSSLRKDKKTELAIRSGRVRVSPHVYNTPGQIDVLLTNLGSARAS